MTVPLSHPSDGRSRARQEIEGEPEPAGLARSRTVTRPRRAGLGPLAARLRIQSAVLQGALALALYLAGWIIFWAYPLLHHDHLVQLDQGSMDPNFYTWSLRWWPYALSHGLNPIFSTEIGAPHGFNLAWTTTVPPLAVAAAPLTTAVGAVASFNLLTVLAAPLSAWVAFLACRRLTGRFWAAFLGAAVFGFSTYEVSHTTAGQLNLTWNLLLPLMLYLLVLWRDEKLNRVWFVILMTLTMALQLFMFLETFAEMTVLLAAGLVVGYALAGRSARPTVARLARQLGLAYVAALALASPYLAYALTHYPKGFSRSPGMTGLNLANLVIPRPTNSFGLAWLIRIANGLPSASLAGYVGIPLLLIVVALAIRTWSSKLTRFLVIMFVIIIALAVGPKLVIGSTHLGSVPWAPLWKLPIARSALPDRFMMIGGLALAAIMALWLAVPVRSRLLRYSRWLVALLAVGAILADVPTVAQVPPSANYQIPSFFATNQYRHYLHRNEIVLVISTRGNAAMLFQADTNFYMRVAGGYINMAITPRSDLPRRVQELSHANVSVDRRFRAFVKQAGIKAILVEQSWEPRWIGILNKMGFRGDAIGGMIVYPVGPCVVRCPAHRHLHASSHAT
jgi:hypothetical protein